MINISGGFLKSTENIFDEQTKFLLNISILAGKKTLKFQNVWIFVTISREIPFPKFSKTFA